MYWVLLSLVGLKILIRCLKIWPFSQGWPDAIRTRTQTREIAIVDWTRTRTLWRIGGRGSERGRAMFYRVLARPSSSVFS